MLWLWLSWLHHRPVELAIRLLLQNVDQSCHLYFTRGCLLWSLSSHKTRGGSVLIVLSSLKWFELDGWWVWTSGGWSNSCHIIVWLKILMESAAVFLLGYHYFMNLAASWEPLERVNDLAIVTGVLLMAKRNSQSSQVAGTSLTKLS